jgi:hypothetical protein
MTTSHASDGIGGLWGVKMNLNFWQGEEGGGVNFLPLRFLRLPPLHSEAAKLFGFTVGRKVQITSSFRSLDPLSGIVPLFAETPKQPRRKRAHIEKLPSLRCFSPFEGYIRRLISDRDELLKRGFTYLLFDSRALSATPAGSILGRKGMT